MEVVSQLEGAFAILVKSTHFPDELIAAKKGSPLLLGAHDAYNVTGNFESSFPAHCKVVKRVMLEMRSRASLCAGLKERHGAETGTLSQPSCNNQPGELMNGDVGKQLPFEAFFSSDAAALVQHTRR
jgi:glucosamine--fructose-6-phosphate aminotransferase (isomerizing)